MERWIKIIISHVQTKENHKAILPLSQNCNLEVEQDDIMLKIMNYPKKTKETDETPKKKKRWIQPQQTTVRVKRKQRAKN